MTDENKNNILDYLTGELNITSPSNQEIFLEQGSIDRSSWANFIPTGYSNFRFEGMIAPNETTSSIGVLYGGYIDNSNNVKGIIVLFDQDFIPIKTITKYDSGTELRYIQYMKQEEDGTFYFIDDTAFSFSQRQQVLTSQKRFVMVNNFTIEMNGEYILRLRISYILRDDYVNFYCKNMYKDPNSSHYIFFGCGTDSTSPSYSYRYLKIWSLKINVGMPNEWNLYVNDASRLFGSAIATFSDDNVRFRCLSSNTKSSATSLVLYEKTYTGSTASNNVITFDYHPYIDDDDYKKQSVFLDYNNVYFVQNNQRWGNTGDLVDKYIGLYKYNISLDKLSTIYNKYLGSYDFCNLEAIYIDRCGTDIYVQYNTNIDNSTTPAQADYYYQRLVNDSWQPILVEAQKNFLYNQRSLFVKANYNLLQIYLYAVNPRQVSWYQYLIKEDYNSLNYNSTSYKDYDAIIPKKAELYSNNKIVFARNLYNRTIYNNISTSTIQIPNSYLNGISIYLNKLLSNTNAVLINNTTSFTKNIYESVLLNFVNSITTIDEDTNTVYPLDANYINTNINVGTQTNFNNTKITKVRLNFDNNSIVKRIVWIDISAGSTIAKQTDFTIYASSASVSIDFISDDENFIYMTKTYNDLVVGNYYTITQKIRIE